MLKKINDIKSKNIRIFISVLFVISIIFIALNFNVRNPEVFSNNPTDTDSAITSIDAARDLVYTESNRTSVSKETVSKRAVYGKRPFEGKGFEAAIICSLLITACIYAVVKLISIRKVLFTHYFIISYIHDLDGMKS